MNENENVNSDLKNCDIDCSINNLSQLTSLNENSLNIVNNLNDLNDYNYNHNCNSILNDKNICKLIDYRV